MLEASEGGFNKSGERGEEDSPLLRLLRGLGLLREGKSSTGIQGDGGGCWERRGIGKPARLRMRLFNIQATKVRQVRLR